MKRLLLFMAMLLAVGSSRADGVFKVNGEEIKKTPTLITLDYSKAGYIQVQFSDSSVVSYNMNLVEFCPNEVNAIQNTMKEGTFFHIKGHVRDVLCLEGITSGAEIAVYSANGERVASEPGRLCLACRSPGCKVYQGIRRGRYYEETINSIVFHCRIECQCTDSAAARHPAYHHY